MRTEHREAAEPAVLTLVAVRRDAAASPGQAARARALPRLREPLTQLDWSLDGQSLRERVPYAPDPDAPLAGSPTDDMLSVADLAWPESAASALRQLAGTEARSSWWPLEPGRLPLYVCSMCADLGCGALTVHVEHRSDTVVWSDIRFEDGRDDPTSGAALPPLGPFTFSRTAYTSVLTAAADELDALAAHDAAGLAAGRRRWWRRGR